MKSYLFNSIRNLPADLPLGDRLPLVYQSPNGLGLKGPDGNEFRLWPKGAATGTADDWRFALPDKGAVEAAARAAPSTAIGQVLILDIETWFYYGGASGQVDPGVTPNDSPDCAHVYEPQIQAQINKYVQLAQWARAANPAIKLGFYGLPGPFADPSNLYSPGQTQTWWMWSIYLSWRFLFDRVASGEFVPGRLPTLIDLIVPRLYTDPNNFNPERGILYWWICAAQAALPMWKMWQATGRPKRIVGLLSPCFNGEQPLIDYDLARGQTAWCQSAGIDRLWWADSFARGADPKQDWYAAASR